MRELFETTVRRCIAEGLVGGEGFAIDASLIKAYANKQRSAEASEPVDWVAATAKDMAWGNRSTLFRDPDSNAINVFKPLTKA